MKDLTQKQRLVLEWAAVGKSNAEIGMLMGTSERTVHSHMHAVCQKLNVCNRTAAAVKYVAPEWYEAKKRG